jgi:sulfur carrier protein
MPLTAAVAKPAGNCKNFICHPAPGTPVIALTVNGEAHQFERALNCRELVERLNLSDKRIAIERNGEIVPRSRHADEMLANGDTLEIVVAVGGG